MIVCTARLGTDMRKAGRREEEGGGGEGEGEGEGEGGHSAGCK